MFKQITVKVGKKTHQVYLNDLIYIVGFTVMASISKLSKLHFIPNDHLHATLLSDSVVSQSALESELGDRVWIDMMESIAYVALLGQLIKHKPYSSWFNTISNLQLEVETKHNDLTKKAKQAVLKYKSLFYKRMMREYDTRPEHDHDKIDLFFFFVFIIVLFIAIAFFHLFLRNRYKKNQISNLFSNSIRSETRLA